MLTRMNSKTVTNVIKNSKTLVPKRNFFLFSQEAAAVRRWSKARMKVLKHQFNKDVDPNKWNDYFMMGRLIRAQKRLFLRKLKHLHEQKGVGSERHAFIAVASLVGFIGFATTYHLPALDRADAKLGPNE